MYYQSEWVGMYDLIIVVRNQSKTSNVIFLVNISLLFCVAKMCLHSHEDYIIYISTKRENKYEIFQDSSSIYFTCIGTLTFVMCNGNQNVVTSFEICRIRNW